MQMHRLTLHTDMQKEEKMAFLDFSNCTGIETLSHIFILTKETLDLPINRRTFMYWKM